MSEICLHCQENETHGHYKICDSCYDDAGNYLERNIELIKAIPVMLDLLSQSREAFNDIPMKRLPEGKTTYDIAAAIGAMQRRIG